MGKIKEVAKIGPAFQYFVRLFKKDKEGKYPNSQNLRIMHGINRISILMFLVAVVVIIYRFATR